VNSPITWGEYVSVRVALWLGGIVFVFLVAVVAWIVQWHRDMHVNDAEKDNHEPYAGKTLGL
jgi:hypothetical protein